MQDNSMQRGEKNTLPGFPDRAGGIWAGYSASLEQPADLYKNGRKHQ